MPQFTLPDLPYAYNALEPYFDEATMRIHHDKHHMAYITNLNKALESQPELADKAIEDIIGRLDMVKEEIRPAVRNHGGGHLNHSLFWQILRPGQADNMPNAQLLELIKQTFGSWHDFQTLFSQAAMTVFGSGWAWLTVVDGKLTIEKTSNQDSPLSQGHRPILGLDVWEHAYYLKYQNRRAEFVENFWPIINWDKVEKNFNQAK